MVRDVIGHRERLMSLLYRKFVNDTVIVIGKQVICARNGTIYF